MRRVLIATSTCVLAWGLSACAQPPEPEPSVEHHLTTTVTTTESAPLAPGTCDPELITGEGDAFEEFVMYCDGTWKYAGHPASDHTWFAQWDGTRWVPLVKDSAHQDTYLPCYSPETLRNEGMPESIIEEFQSIGPVCADNPDTAKTKTP